MKSAVCVRTYRDWDEDAVLGIWERAGLNRPWLNMRAEIAEKRKRDRSLFLVAVEDKRIIGVVMGAYDGRRGWVYHLGVEPSLQSRGIGRRLMTELERRMTRLGVQKVNLQVRADNTRVVQFYERQGYVDPKLTSLEKWLIPPSDGTWKQ